MAEPVLSAKGVVKSYLGGPAPVEVLRGLDLAVSEGEFISVVGPSGSGKSTLLHVVGLMDRYDAGEVSLRGHKTSGLDEVARARLRGGQIGFMFQFDSMLPEFTILENVLMPARIAGRAGAETRARGLLDSLGVGAIAERFPAQTSGGERQRAAVARALLNDPALLLADEPTGNLDRDNGAKVFADFRRVAKEQKTAVILVTHDEPNARAADRMLRMQGGRLVPA